MQMAGANPGIHCFRGRPPKSCAALTGLRMAALFICFAALMQGAAFAVCTHPHRGVIYPEVWSLQQPTVQLATLQKLTTRGCLIAGFILVLLWTSKQITPRCSLVRG
ncbi:hypothetical protein ACTACK_10385 [Pseudomonas syringae]|uniref:hypothetical protein n=1 Tax=Pseudomonas syringae TaxID=317 RepID=UPI003F74B95D